MRLLPKVSCTFLVAALLASCSGSIDEVNVEVDQQNNQNPDQPNIPGNQGGETPEGCSVVKMDTVKDPDKCIITYRGIPAFPFKFTSKNSSIDALKSGTNNFFSVNTEGSADNSASDLPDVPKDKNYDCFFSDPTDPTTRLELPTTEGACGPHKGLAVYNVNDDSTSIYVNGVLIEIVPSEEIRQGSAENKTAVERFVDYFDNGVF